MEIIVENENVCWFNGKKYYLNSRGYFGYVESIRVGAKTVIQHSSALHRDVWEFHNGAIPEGFAVHHKDLNKANNSLTNLVLMLKADHSRLHRNSYTNEDTLFAWHRSKEGREQAKNRYEKFIRPLLFAKMKKKCALCGKEYTTSHNARNNSRYCSHTCAYRAWVAGGAQSGDCTCETCNKVFTGDTHAVTKYCSKECRRIGFLSHKKSFVCDYCGTAFERVTPKKENFCSRKCALLHKKEAIRVSASTKCETCGKEFPTSKYDPARFCSKECFTAEKTYICGACGDTYTTCSPVKRGGVPLCKKCKPKQLHGVPPLTQESLCPVCGKTFKQQVRHAKVTCSKECQYKLTVLKTRSTAVTGV